jgi:hypothetical protein
LRKQQSRLPKRGGRDIFFTDKPDAAVLFFETRDNFIHNVAEADLRRYTQIKGSRTSHGNVKTHPKGCATSDKIIGYDLVAAGVSLRN